MYFRRKQPFVEKGKDLGDASVMDLKKPSIAVMCEPPTSATAYGAIWFLLEKTYDIPFTAIREAIWAARTSSVTTSLSFRTGSRRGTPALSASREWSV